MTTAKHQALGRVVALEVFEFGALEQMAERREPSSGHTANDDTSRERDTEERGNGSVPLPWDCGSGRGARARLTGKEQTAQAVLATSDEDDDDDDDDEETDFFPMRGAGARPRTGSAAVQERVGRAAQDGKLERMVDACRTILEVRLWCSERIARRVVCCWAELWSLLRLVWVQCLGEDPSRDGLRKTPTRMARSLFSMTGGYEMDARDVLQSAMFTVDAGRQSMVVVKDVEFSSLCEHHVLPFVGRVHIGYLPGSKVIGLSKLARLTDVVAKRLQVQERMTRQIAEAVFRYAGARGVAVLVEASHMCMVMRGAKKPGSETTTTCFLGEFADSTELRSEFFHHLERRR